MYIIKISSKQKQRNNSIPKYVHLEEILLHTQRWIEIQYKVNKCVHILFVRA